MKKLFYAFLAVSFVIIVVEVVLILFPNILISLRDLERKKLSKTQVVVTPGQQQISISDINEYPFNTAPFKNGYQIGQVLVYLDDLDNYFKIYYSNTLENRANLKNWQRVAELISEDAILQNEGINLGLFENSKDRRIDHKKVNEARDYLKTEGTTYISGERISVWFHNTPPPKIELSLAREKAEAIIKDLYEKLINNKNYTLKDAGEAIAANTQLENIDIAYKTNAYRSFKYVKPDEEVSTDNDLNKILWNLNEGQMSEIVVGKDFNANKNEWYDAYYAIIKVTEKRQKEYNNLDELFSSKKNQGMFIVFK